jgi:hypothetical protein
MNVESLLAKVRKQMVLENLLFAAKTACLLSVGLGVLVHVTRLALCGRWYLLSFFLLLLQEDGRWLSPAARESAIRLLDGRPGEMLHIFGDIVESRTAEG